MIEHIAQESGVAKTQVNSVLDALAGTIVTALKGGDSISLSGIGTFSISERAERTGRNPQTGAAITIQAKTMPKFKAGKDFSAKIAGEVAGK